jgi:hypothetical protein
MSRQTGEPEVRFGCGVNRMHGTSGDTCGWSITIIKERIVVNENAGGVGRSLSKFEEVRQMR